MLTSSALGQAALFGQIGGMFSSAIGGYFSAKSQKLQLKANAQTADTNARIAELGAQSELSQGQQQAGAISLRAGKLKSSQRAAMAANGIDLGEGNAAEIQASTDVMKEIDINTTLANSVRSAWGYRMQGTNFSNQSRMDNAAASSISPASTAFTSLLGGAGNVASSWYQLNKLGALKGTMFGVE